VSLRCGCHRLIIINMDAQTFNEPRLALNRIYTKTGDKGETSLAGGQRLPKDALRIEAYGTVDELNAFVGAACLTAEGLVASYDSILQMALILKRVQHELFNLGSILATKPEDVHPKQPRITEAEIDLLESEIDQMNADLPALRSFVLPGGCRLNVDLHLCRTVCRRAERICVALARQEDVPAEAIRYLNRLSDAFFVWSRWTSHQLRAPEVLWEPNQAASALPRLK
jgi:cob(I)alamin adenosyltransferase